MKQRKTITIDDWLIKEIKRRHPRARKNFSMIVNALLTAAVNNPLQYWKAQAKYHNVKMQMALEHVQTLETLVQQKKKRYVIEEVQQ